MTTHYFLEADPDNIICDFCSAPNPRWEFQIEGGHRIGEDHIGDREISSMDADGRWAACDMCKYFIVHRQTGKLARRSARSYMKLYPIIPESELPNIVARIRQAHNFFFVLWDGSEPKPVE